MRRFHSTQHLLALFGPLWMLSGCGIKFNAMDALNVASDHALESAAPAAATSLGFVQISPQSTGSITPAWTKSASSDLASQSLQLYSDGICVTPSGGPVSLGAATTQTATTLRRAGTYSYRITSTDSDGNSTLSACSTPMVVDRAFHRGIAFGPNTSALTIGGNPWIPQSTAVTEGLTYSTAMTDNANTLDRFGNPVVSSPAVDSDTETMLTNNTWNSSADLGFDYPLANGIYEVYFWIRENYDNQFRSFEIHLENVKYVTEAGEQNIGSWTRAGPYFVEVTDADLSVLLKKERTDPLLSGLEIYSVSAFPSFSGESFAGPSIDSRVLTQTSFVLPTTLSSGKMVVTPPANTAPNATYSNVYGGLVNINAMFDLTGKSLSIDLVSVLNTSAAQTQNYFQVYFGGTGSYAEFYVHGNTIEYCAYPGGCTGAATYSNVTHRYLRYLHDAGTGDLLMQTSSDRTTWVTRKTVSGSLPVVKTGFYLGAGVWASVASPGTFEVGDITVQ